MSLELTPKDEWILAEYRLERLRSFFGETLHLCCLQLDRANSLTIHCSEPWIVDRLIDEMDQLRWYAWMMTGAYCVRICFAKEEIYRSTTHHPRRKAHCSRLKVKGCRV